MVFISVTENKLGHTKLYKRDKECTWMGRELKQCSFHLFGIKFRKEVNATSFSSQQASLPSVSPVQEI